MESSNMTGLGLLANSSLIDKFNSETDPMNQVLNIVMLCAVFVIMFSLGCTMEVRKIESHIVRPKGVVIALVAQYGIMPLTGFLLAKAFQLQEVAAVVVLICGCSPGGLLSNIASLAIKGDMNLSLVMTTCSTTLALGMMPLLLLVYCQGFDNLQEAVPYRGIIFSLLSILIPCGVGILLNHYRPQFSNIITKTGVSISTIILSVVVVLTVVDSGDNIFIVMSPPLLAIAVLMPMIGYTLGYILSALFRLTKAECRTVSMETGCQNGQLCMALIKVAFPAEVVGTLFLFPFIYVFCQFIEAALLVLLFRTHQYWTHRSKGDYRAAKTNVEEVTETEATKSV